MTAPDHFAKTELDILRRRGPSTYVYAQLTAYEKQRSHTRRAALREPEHDEYGKEGHSQSKGHVLASDQVKQFDDRKSLRRSKDERGFISEFFSVDRTSVARIKSRQRYD
jgi:hypothetical protein